MPELFEHDLIGVLQEHYGKNFDVTTSQNEFNKLLCDDCYTEYRHTLQNMFDLKDLFEVDDLLSSINRSKL
jgi:hypothetical protein